LQSSNNERDKVRTFSNIFLKWLVTCWNLKIVNKFEPCTTKPKFVTLSLARKKYFWHFKQREKFKIQQHSKIYYLETNQNLSRKLEIISLNQLNKNSTIWMYHLRFGFHIHYWFLKLELNLGWKVNINLNYNFLRQFSTNIFLPRVPEIVAFIN
jgi:hypothetical protein